jgi:signal transduction histidine kinase
MSRFSSWLFAGFLIGSASGAAAAPTEKSIPITCAYLVSGEPISAASIASGAHATGFKPIDCTSSAFGFDPRTYWMRVEFSQPSSPTETLVEVSYTALDNLAFHQLADSGLRTSVSGDMLPFGARSIFHRSFVFDQVLVDRPLYIEVKTDGSVQIPVKAYPAVAFAEKSTTEFMSMGLYYGILLAMILYNAFLFFVIRDLTYLYYVLYVACYGGFQAALNGVGYMYLWPSSITWNNYSIPLLIAAMFAFMFLFAMRFLNSAANTPWMHRLLQFWFGLSVAATAAAPFLPLRVSIKSIVLFSIFAAIIVLAAGIRAVMVGYKPARYFLIAWATFLIGIVAISLKNFGILPAGFVTDYGMQIGSALETVLLSMGLGYRIRQAEDARSRALLEAARVEQESIKDRAVAKTTQMLAHDVHRPFNILSGLLATLRDSEDPKEVKALAAKFLPEVDKALVTVKGMIQDVMEVGRETEMVMKPIDTRSLIERCVETVMLGFPKLQIHFEYDLAKDLNLLGDEQRLSRAVCNVIANAIEASAANGRVWIQSAVQDDRWLRLTIGNQGRAIDQDVGAKLFESFFSAGKPTGTGLGLAIAKKVVEKHGGQIWFESKDGQTEFHLTVPVCRGEIARQLAAAPKVVVVVDDCAWTRDSWQKQSADFDVMTFSGPTELRNGWRHDLCKGQTVFVLDYCFDGDDTTGGDLAVWLREQGAQGLIYLASERDDLNLRDMPDVAGVLPKDPRQSAAKLSAAMH